MVFPFIASLVAYKLPDGSLVTFTDIYVFGVLTLIACYMLVFTMAILSKLLSFTGIVIVSILDID